MKVQEIKKGYTDGYALMVISGETEMVETVDKIMNDFGFHAGSQDNDDGESEIMYGVKRSDVQYFRKCYKEAKGEVK